MEKVFVLTGKDRYCAPLDLVRIFDSLDAANEYAKKLDPSFTLNVNKQPIRRVGCCFKCNFNLTDSICDMCGYEN